MKKKANQKDELLILVTNDDGITASGIKALVEEAVKFGKVVVVAPDSPQSGMGHAVSIDKPLRLRQSSIFESINVDAWECSGTPVDCVKLANDVVLHRKPDICLSGINHGSNAAVNVIYSGTMSAAMEAAIEGIPSAGFSNLDYRSDGDMDVAKMVVKEVLQKMIKEKLPAHFLLNVNIPIVDKKDFKGIKICTQADARWTENFVHRVDPRGMDYYWMTGKFENRDKRKDTDLYALKNNFASVVPISFDLTHQQNKDWLDEHWSK